MLAIRETAARHPSAKLPAAEKSARTSLEDAKTEFQVQGLELVTTLVRWAADVRRPGDDWSDHRFRGAKQTNVKKPE